MLGEQAVDRARRAAASSATIPPRVTSQPVAAIWAASAIWLASRTWPGRGVASAGAELVPGRQHRHPRAAKDLDGDDAEGGQQRQIRGAQPAARRKNRLAAGRLLAGLHDVGAGRHGARDLDAGATAAAVAAAAEGRRLLDHHHGVGVVGEKAAGGDLHRLARPPFAREDVAHRHRSDDVQHDQRQLGGGVDVGGAHREAVHDRPPLGGEVVRRREGVPEDAPLGGRERHALVTDGRRLGEDLAAPRRRESASASGRRT